MSDTRISIEDIHFQVLKYLGQIFWKFLENCFLIENIWKQLTKTFPQKIVRFFLKTEKVEKHGAKEKLVGAPIGNAHLSPIFRNDF